MKQMVRMGVDGCRGGWLIAKTEGDRGDFSTLSLSVVPKLAQALKEKALKEKALKEKETKAEETVLEEEVETSEASEADFDSAEETEEEVGDGREPCAGPGESEDEGVEQIEWRAEEQGGRALDEKAGRCVTGTVDLVLGFVCVHEEDETKEGQEGQEEGGSVQQRLRPHGVDGDHEQRDRRAMNAADVPTAISRGYM